MRDSVHKAMATVWAILLSVLPVVLGLGFRGVEAWELWYEMTGLTPRGVIAWVWATAFVVAVCVTQFHLDDHRSLRYWDILIDASNGVISFVLALDYAEQSIGALGTHPYSLRFVVLFLGCLIPQLMIAFIARRARHVARRLRRQLCDQGARGANDDDRDTALNASTDHPHFPEGGAATAEKEKATQKPEALVG